MDKDAKEKILEYDIIRVIAVILVVLGHCTYRTIITDYGGYSLIQNIDLITPLGKIVFTIFKSITAFIFTFHMPLFFVLSGALFSNSLNRGKYKTLKELVVNKGKRLLIPFFIVTLLYAVPIKYISGYYSKSTNLFKDIFVGQILMQGNTHLWFLPTLFCIFCIIYILHRFKLPKILIIVALFLLNFFSFFPKISLLDHISLYLMYFYIGFCFEIKRNKISNEIDKMKIKEFLILIISFTIMRIGFYYIMKFYNLGNVAKFIEIIMKIIQIFIIYVIAYKLSNINKIADSKVIRKISEYSFGIYLYSDPLNYLLLFIVNTLYSQYIYTAMGITILYFARLFVTFFGGMLMTYILKKLKIKYIK